MSEAVHLSFVVPGDDFTRAGEASGAIKSALKKLGLSPETVRKAAIASYEGEINMVIHAGGGQAEVDITPEAILIRMIDQGPGIADVALAMREGYTTAPDEVRNLGFGAGMGLPNMKKYTDEMTVESVVGKGTTVYMKVDI